MNLNYELSRYRYDMEKCVGCKGCVWVDHIYMPNVRFGIRCPSNIYELFDAYSSLGRLKIGLAMLEGRVSYSDKLLDVIYRCNLCGACDAGCKRNLDLEPLLVLESLRVKCVRDGKGPLEEHQEVVKNIMERRNRFGAPERDRLKWIPLDSTSQSSEMVYFPGCASSYLDNDISKATVEIMKAGDITFNTLGDKDRCCGHPLVDMGFIDQAREIAEANIRAIKEIGVNRVLTSCAECYKTWKVDYPKLLGKSTGEMEYNVIHISQLVDDLQEKGVLQFTREVNMKVTWHDPCHLGRLSEPWIEWKGDRGRYGLMDTPKEYRRGTYGIYHAPRNILKRMKGLTFIEMPRTRENTLCCGAGGGTREAFRDYASFIARERIEEARSISVEAIITACPYCKDNFKKVGEGMKIYDLSELILMAL